MSDKNKNTKNARRNFIKNAFAGLGIIAGLEVIWMTLSFLAPKKNANSTIVSNIKTVGNINNIAKDSVTPVRSGQFYLVRMSDGGFLAVSLKCSHLGCSVTWDSSRRRFICPCHASEFDMKGNVISPPAPRALDYYPVIVEQGMVKVNIGKPEKRKKFERSQATYV